MGVIWAQQYQENHPAVAIRILDLRSLAPLDYDAIGDVVNATLENTNEALNEVVVIGYGTQRKRDLTGAVASVKAKDFNQGVQIAPDQLIQGKVAGVQVINNSGQPGGATTFRIRGNSSLRSGNQPLFVIDGVPVNSGMTSTNAVSNYAQSDAPVDYGDGMSDINPDDIESTTVLKDAAAASIYGARAANGVIVYTTKRGSRNKKLRVDYNGMYGFTDPGTGLDMSNPQEYADLTWLAEKNTAALQNRAPAYGHPQFGTGSSPVMPYYLSLITRNPQTGAFGVASGQPGPLTQAQIDQQREWYNVDPTRGTVRQLTRAMTGEGTDWYAALTRTAPLHRHSIGFNGGSETSRFYIGLGMQEQAGIMIGNQFKRYSLRANSEFDVTKRIRIGQNFQATYRQVLGQQGGTGGRGVSDDENDILQAFRMPSIIPVYDEFGGYGHPDHIQAHRVAMRAAEKSDWDIPKIYWNVMPVSVIQEGIDAMKGIDSDFWGAEKAEDLPFAKDDSFVHALIDGNAYVDKKMNAMKAHSTQIAVDGPFFALSNNVGLQVWGYEYYTLVKGEKSAPLNEKGYESDLFAGIKL